ncbi:hypothetical protein D5a_00365 [Faustovirus]|nr:hypothetical protein D5a_00365 [Faustovirus]
MSDIFTLNLIIDCIFLTVFNTYESVYRSKSVFKMVKLLKHKVPTTHPMPTPINAVFANLKADFRPL